MSYATSLRNPREEGAAEEKNEQRLRAAEARAQARSHEASPGEGSLPEKSTPIAQELRDCLPCPQAEESSKQIWHPKEFDPDWPVGGHRGIARQALGPREAKMRPLCPRQERRCRAALAGRALRLPYLEVLLTHQLHTGSPMLSPAPVTPEERLTPDGEGMQEATFLARLCGGAAIPLARLSQGTGTTTAKTGSIHHAQAAIGFSAMFMREQLLVSRAACRRLALGRRFLG